MFKPTVIAAALVAVSAPAFAGGLAPLPAEPVVPAPVAVTPAPVAPSADWSGFYAGGALGFGSIPSNAETQGSDGGLPTKPPVGGVQPGPSGILLDDAEGTIYGVHAGYLHDFGQIVAGGELSYMTGDIEEGGFEFDSLLALKARVGYDAGRILPYATAGYAQLGSTGPFNENEDGFLFGVGVDYALTDSIRLGVEAARHQFNDVADTEGNDVNFNTVSLRASFAF